MKFVFEKDEVNSKEFPELFNNAFEAFKYILSNIDEGAEISSINLYIAAKTSQGKHMSGFTDFGNCWIVKPIDHEKATYSDRIQVSDKYSDSFKYKDADGKELVKLYYSIDPKLIMNNKGDV